MTGVSLDTKNLANIAHRLEADHQSQNPATDDPKDLEALEVDDEACTMQPVGDTITRSSTLISLALRITNSYRLLRRALILELFHEDQEPY